MQLIAPDILEDACGLSAAVLATALGLGLMLWLLGWRSHRFWVVLTATATAGLYGLAEAPAWNTHPMLIAVLLAVSAGLLALALVRVFAFAAGGLAGLVAVGHVAPNLEQPLICFLACGLLGLVLFRLSLMALTSFVGAVVMAHAGLALAHRTETFNAVAWAQESGVILNWACGLAALLGFVMQVVLDRRKGKDKDAPVEGAGGWSLFGRGQKALPKAG